MEQEKVEWPKTLEEFEKVRGTILDLMANPYCHEFMFRSLSDRLDKVDLIINKLKEEAHD